MTTPPNTRQKFHQMLDEILDSAAPSDVGMLMICEVAVSEHGQLVRSLLMKGVLGKNADLLRKVRQHAKDLLE